MQFNISYWSSFIIITMIWAAFSLIKKIKDKKTCLKTEVRIFLFYICIVVIVRIVYFPWHHVNGHIDTLNFDSSKIIPFWLNLIPLVHLFDVYDGWQMNIIGNISMFIPVGIIWPFCFKKLNSVWKTTLACGGFSFFIEISQLLFYQRSSDVDDLILNTTGAFIGAVIYFSVRKGIALKKNQLP